MAKIPTTTATKLNEAYLTPTIRGIAKKKYLRRIDINPTTLAFVRDLPKILGIDFPMRKKLIMLKHAPNTTPLAIDLSWKKRKIKAEARAHVMAQKQILL
jgi:hypothetical protein